MATESPETQTPAQVDWRRIHALGLPSGSVRALMAVLVFATTWGLLVLRPSDEVPVYLRDLLFVIMGHYFASRHRADQGAEPGPGPLYLPRGSVRFVLVVGTLGVAAVLLRRGQLTEIEKNPGVVTLLMVGGFLLGVVANAVITWWRDRGHQPHRFFEDVRALVSMAAAVLLVALVWTRLFPVVPASSVSGLFSGWGQLGRFGPENVLAAVVGFYFGSKS
jgi:hypothetical protein